VPDYTLSARSPLNGYDHDFAGARIAETPGFALVSIATNPANKSTLAVSVKKAFGLALPDGGTSASKGAYTLISSAADQWLLRFAHSDGTDPSVLVRTKLGTGPAVTDQSDNWVQVEVSGPRATETLERICPLDLNEQVFTKGRVGRTSMEHLGTIICKQADDGTFLLMSASSSAQSFLHAIQVSAKNTL
jgi:heterotetrameric sarcosine oxidase gamma subunit